MYYWRGCQNMLLKIFLRKSNEYEWILVLRNLQGKIIFIWTNRWLASAHWQRSLLFYIFASLYNVIIHSKSKCRCTFVLSICVIDLKSKNRLNEETIIGANDRSLTAPQIWFHIICRIVGQEHSKGWVTQLRFLRTFYIQTSLRPNWRWMGDMEDRDGGRGRTYVISLNSLLC